VGHQDERKTYRELGSDAIKAGTAAVELYHRYPSTLPVLLGWFGNTSIRAVMLRRLLLWLNISPTLLIRVGGLARHRPGVYKLFRFLHAYCFWSGVRRALPSSGWRRLSSGTAILMYHAFGDEHEEASRYVVPVKLFRLHMAVLWWLRYRVLSLEDYVDYRQSCALPPARSVVITIDDGYADNVTLAAPVLRRYGFPATFFLVSRAIGTKNSWDQDGALARRPLVSTDAARSLNEAPLGVGAHTQSHPVLTALTEAEQAQEISRSRSDLEQLVGKRITVFSYPYGKHNETTKRLVAQAGFEAACAVTPGLTWLNTPLYGLHRIEIFGSDHILRFIYKLITGAKCIKSPAIAWYRRLKELRHDS
jgi:peptidoglycan/xylan/chitin deacetylase (PgdA/CDA1 family)